jgi:hypothetical protein
LAWAWREGLGFDVTKTDAAAAEEQIRARIAEVKAEREKLQQTFNERFPDYAALSKPQPLSVAETQALLADDEALLVFDFGPKSYAWIISKNDADWAEPKISAGDLDAQVRNLRAWLTDPRKRFDADLAYKIYQETFGALVDKIGSKERLSIVTNGALTSLPLRCSSPRSRLARASEARIVERRQRRLAARSLVTCLVPPQLRSVFVTKTLLWHRTLRPWPGTARRSGPQPFAYSGGVAAVALSPLGHLTQQFTPTKLRVLRLSCAPNRLGWGLGQNDLEVRSSGPSWNNGQQFVVTCGQGQLEARIVERR